MSSSMDLFNSGTVPSADEQAEAIQAIGRRVDDDGGHTDTSIDALAQCRTTRRWVQLIATSAAPRHRDPHDGHLAFIESHDRARSFRHAHEGGAEAGARSALRSESLTLASMQSWQRVVLGTRDVEFRRFFHPFEDGNARAARLALDLSSLGRGLRCTRRSLCFWWRDSPTTGRARTRCRPWSSRLCARFRRRGRPLGTRVT